MNYSGRDQDGIKVNLCDFSDEDDERLDIDDDGSPSPMMMGGGRKPLTTSNLDRAEGKDQKLMSNVAE